MRTFDYFAEPLAYSTWNPEATCGVCGGSGGFEEPFIGEADLAAICDDCMASGKLVRLELYTNQANSVTLRTQLASKKLPMSEAEAIIDARLEALEQCTPAWVSWQDQVWPAHCADFARYVKVMGQQDVLERCGDEAPEEWLRSALEDPEENDIEDLWQAMRPGSPVDQSEAWGTEFYLFECRECGKPIVMWDCD